MNKLFKLVKKAKRTCMKVRHRCLGLTLVSKAFFKVCLRDNDRTTINI